METIVRRGVPVMGIRGKWRHPEWSNGLKDVPEYCGNPIAFIGGKCDIVLGQIWIVVEKKAVGRFRLCFKWAGTEEAVGLTFPWEDEHTKNLPGVNLTTRDGLTWKSACGYINAVRLGLWRARRMRL